MQIKMLINKIKSRIRILINYRKNYANRDNIILTDKNRPTIPNIVNVHWFSANREDGKENVGDMISPVIVNYLLQQKGIDPLKKLKNTKHLFAIGSVLFFGLQDSVVWGSGMLVKPRCLVRYPKYDFRSVRGPETRKLLLGMKYSVPEVYGDPAILMPLVYSPKKTNDKNEYGVVLHKDTICNSCVNNNIDIIVSDYKVFIDRICACKKIITTSLHGIILAEAYGIPAVLVRDNRKDFNLLKYNDYYYSTGRYSYPIADTIDDAINLTPADIPDFSQMQRNIINAFPYDLWNE